VGELSELEYDLEYSSSLNDLIDDFYLPVLGKSVTYDRAAGFFSSAIFWAIETTLCDFVARRGRIRIICSPRLSATDRDAVLTGMEDRRSPNKALESALQGDLREWDDSFGSRAPSSLLRHLVASGSLEMKFAVPRTSDGMFHDKYGIFHDLGGSAIAFLGSLNESLSGWTAYGSGNHESFHVFRSWVESDTERAESIKARFKYHWDEKSSFLNYFNSARLPDVFEPRDDDLDEQSAIEQIRLSRTNKMRGARSSKKPKSQRELQEHQTLAIKNWNVNGKRGIICFVTGGGKTLTALAIVRNWVSDRGISVICVPTRDLLRQWRREVDLEIALPDSRIVQAGAGVGPDHWVNNLRSAVEQDQGCIILTTYDSARDEKFLYQFARFKRQILLVADEVHEIGAPGNQRILDSIHATARLGLSATPERYGDDLGTARIFEYFGKKIEPEFGFRDARSAGRLCQYTYDIHEARLVEEEQQKFDNLSQAIMIALVAFKSGTGTKERLDLLRRERARIVKQATDKTRVAVHVIRNRLLRRDLSGREPHWLVYCNSILHLRRILEEVKPELLTRNINALEYHSQMKEGERDAVLDTFERSGGVLFAVKCLDEGIDIPSINGAIIVASSTNPREYIQRRGRVLRCAINKPYAELHDIVTLTTGGGLALESELTRAREIAECAENKDRVLSDLEYVTGIPTVEFAGAIETEEIV
jgi:superfamily II DNA or RNA helicase